MILVLPLSISFLLTLLGFIGFVLERRKKYLTMFLVSIPAGFMLPYPVNYWMIKKNLKKCH